MAQSQQSNQHIKKNAVLSAMPTAPLDECSVHCGCSGPGTPGSRYPRVAVPPGRGTPGSQNPRVPVPPGRG